MPTRRRWLCSTKGWVDHSPLEMNVEPEDLIVFFRVQVQQHSLQVDMVGELDDFLGMDTSMRNLTVSPSISNTDECDTVDSDGTEGKPYFSPSITGNEHF